MKLIHVYSDESEYAAEDFIKNFNIRAAYETAKSMEDETWEFSKGCYCKAIDYANVYVTPDFIDFIKSTIGDSDMLKHENFYVVEY